jgi:hypothetical protein
MQDQEEKYKFEALDILMHIRLDKTIHVYHLFTTASQEALSVSITPAPNTCSIFANTIIQKLWLNHLWNKTSVNSISGICDHPNVTVITWNI